MTAPRVDETLRALMQLSERLEQAYGTLGDVLALRSSEDAIATLSGSPVDALGAIQDCITRLTEAAAASRAVTDRLAPASSTLYNMGHQGV